MRNFKTAAIIFIFFEVSIDAYVGVVISLFILKTGVEIMIGSFGDMFGRRSDSDVAKRIKDIVRSEPGVSGAYDLIINNYGPGRDYASIHVEVDSSMTAEEIEERIDLSFTEALSSTWPERSMQPVIALAVER